MPAWYALLLGEDMPADLSPRDAKHALARRLVERLHSEVAGEAAAGHFERVVVRGDVPEEIAEESFQTVDGAVHMPALIADAFGGSRSDARRKLAQGAVKLDGTALGAQDIDVSPERLDGAVLQVGKRQFRRLRRTG
jgi:tyrosyl-tRNA synthetase